MKGSKQNEVRPIKADGDYSLYKIQILKNAFNRSDKREVLRLYWA